MTFKNCLSLSLKTSPPCPPSDRLTHIVRLGLKAEEELEHARKASIVVSDNIQDIGKISRVTRCFSLHK